MTWDMIETLKAFLLKKNEFPYEWLDSYDKLLWPVETMPLKSPVDFAKKAQSQHSAGIPPHIPPLWWHTVG